jgi:hypothetical protein
LSGSDAVFGFVLMHVRIPGHVLLWQLHYYVRGTQLYASLAGRIIAG